MRPKLDVLMELLVDRVSELLRIGQVEDLELVSLPHFLPSKRVALARRIDFLRELFRALSIIVSRRLPYCPHPGFATRRAEVSGLGIHDRDTPVVVTAIACSDRPSIRVAAGRRKAP